MDIKPIKTDRDHRRALRRIEEIWDAPGNSAESDELDVLATLIDAYERERFPIDLPDPVEAIRFRLEQQGHDLRSLIGVIGQRTRVYEVMHHKRPLSLNMIRRLYERFGIPPEVLIQSRRPSCKPAAHRRSAALKRPAIRKSA